MKLQDLEGLSMEWSRISYKVFYSELPFQQRASARSRLWLLGRRSSARARVGRRCGLSAVRVRRAGSRKANTGMGVSASGRHGHAHVWILGRAHTERGRGEASDSAALCDAKLTRTWFSFGFGSSSRLWRLRLDGIKLALRTAGHADRQTRHFVRDIKRTLALRGLERATAGGLQGVGAGLRLHVEPAAIGRIFAGEFLQFLLNRITRLVRGSGRRFLARNQAGDRNHDNHQGALHLGSVRSAHPIILNEGHKNCGHGP